MKRIPCFILAALLLAANLLMVSGAAAAGCTVSAVGVVFGNFSPLTITTVENTGSITVNCTDVSSYSIVLSAGGGDFSQRRMTTGGGSPTFLNYNLYRDATYQQVWGDGSSGNDTVSLSNPVNGQNNIHTIYGRIPVGIQRNAHVGSYSDTITVTVAF